jgi:hypothetical protein
VAPTPNTRSTVVGWTKVNVVDPAHARGATPPVRHRWQVIPLRALLKTPAISRMATCKDGQHEVGILTFPAMFIARYLIDLDQEFESRSLLHSVLAAEAWDMPDCRAGRALPSCSAASAFEPQLSRLWDVIAPMNSGKQGL